MDNNKCKCSKCQCSQHSHNKKNNYVNCINASLLKCRSCPKIICELCYETHLNNHKNKCLCSRCQCTQHDHNKKINHVNCGNASLFKCKSCPKLICELCYALHNERHG